MTVVPYLSHSVTYICLADALDLKREGVNYWGGIQGVGTWEQWGVGVWCTSYIT